MKKMGGYRANVLIPALTGTRLERHKSINEIRMYNTKKRGIKQESARLRVRERNTNKGWCR